jgi:hypothetical protein
MWKSVGFVPQISLTQSAFIEMSVQHRENERVYSCVLGLSILPV